MKGFIGAFSAFFEVQIVMVAEFYGVKKGYGGSSKDGAY